MPPSPALPLSFSAVGRVALPSEVFGSFSRSEASPFMMRGLLGGEGGPPL